MKADDTGWYWRISIPVGHAVIPQAWDSEGAPSHICPPFWAVWSTILIRRCVPPPHVAEQLVHWLHALHVQLTVSGKEERNIITWRHCKGLPKFYEVFSISLFHYKLNAYNTSGACSRSTSLWLWGRSFTHLSTILSCLVHYPYPEVRATTTCCGTASPWAPCTPCTVDCKWESGKENQNMNCLHYPLSIPIGHALVPQVLVSAGSPSHIWPPLWAVCSTVLVRSCVPPPHVAEQLIHEFHAPQVQLTEMKDSSWVNRTVHRTGNGIRRIWKINYRGKDHCNTSVILWIVQCNYCHHAWPFG